MSKTRINNIDLAYDDTGSGPAVVLIHGYPFNRSMWAEQVSALADSYRVVTLDLRGHGESESSTGASTMKLMAQDVASLMDELRIDRAVIGGLSMGGYVTLAFYQLFAERVEKLLLADTRAQGSADPAEAAKVLARYPKANARAFTDTGAATGRLTEADALIAYLQSLGTTVDFKLYDDKANIR